MANRAVTLLFACSGLGLAALTPANAQSPDFATKASVGNTFEVQESQLALDKAASPKVKSFAKMMIKDHSAAEKKLQAAAKDAKVEMMLDPPHQAMVDALGAKSGADFDAAYVNDQVAAHQETAGLLADYIKTGDDPKLKAWAKKTLPTVNAHLKKVQAMAKTS